MNYVEPKDRNIAMVFQNYALYPHMSVYENNGLCLKITKKEIPILDENGKQIYVVDEDQIKK